MKHHKSQINTNHLIDLLDQTDTLLSFVDTGYVYKIINKAYARRFNQPVEDIIGQSIQNIMGEDEFYRLVKPNIDKALAGEKIQYEAWFRSPDSDPSYLIVSYTPSFSEDGTVSGVIVSVINHTAIKLSEEEKQKHDAMMVEISKMVQLGEMISFLSHQWRKPLNTLATYLLKIRALIPHNDDVIAAIDRSETILDSLSNDMENMYALYSQNSVSKDTLLSKSVLQVIGLVQDRIRAFDIHLDIHIAETICVQAPYDEVMHIILVFIENAIDAVCESSNNYKEIRIMAEVIDSFVVIDIIDNGGGISEPNMYRIFQPGFTTKSNSGQGYGLYFANKIITERLNGSVRVEPYQYGGWFRVKLPVV